MKCDICGKEYKVDDINIVIRASGGSTTKNINSIQLPDGSKPSLCGSCLYDIVSGLSKIGIEIVEDEM